MKKITIKEYKKTKCAYTIVLENVRFDENGFEIIEKIIKRFMVGDELFFGFYRTDGVNITSKQFKDYEKEIKTIFYKGIMPSEKVLDFPVDCNTLAGSVNL